MKHLHFILIFSLVVEIYSLDDNSNEILFIKGSIPGAKNTEVLVKKSVKNISKLTIKERIENLEKLKKTPEKKKK